MRRGGANTGEKTPLQEDGKKERRNGRTVEGGHKQKSNEPPKAARG
jgi:hypothetical protein